MPVQHHIHILEQPVAHHVHFARSALLGRRSVVSQRPRHMVLHHVLLHRDRRQRRTRAQQIMSTAMSRGSAHDWVALRHGLLRQARQRFELTQNRNHRLTLAITRNKAGRLICHAGLYLKPSVLQLHLEQTGTLVLVIPQFGIVPDLL